MAKAKKVRLDDYTIEKWDEIPPEKYPLLQLIYLQEIRNVVKGINNWISFIGIVLIIYIILAILNFFLSY